MAELKPTQVMLKRVHIAFPELAEPTPGMDGGNERYRLTVLIDKDDKKQLKSLKAAIVAAREEGAAKHKWSKTKAEKAYIPLRDGNDRFDPDEGKYENFENRMFVNATSGPDRQPTMVDLSKKEIPGSTFRSGNLVNVLLSFYPFDAKANHGVGASVDLVQWLDKGEGSATKVSVSEVDDLLDGPEDDDDDDFFGDDE